MLYQGKIILNFTINTLQGSTNISNHDQIRSLLKLRNKNLMQQHITLLNIKKVIFWDHNHTP